MARLSRSEVFSPDQVAVVHVMNRVVQRCFLLGTDAVTGKNYDHRKVWVERQLERLAAWFGIDLLGFSILSNHFHLILRSRPDVVAMWDDTEVARRWLMLCPLRKTEEGLAEEPNENELNSLRNDPLKLATIRLRLSDIAWWMRLLCQHIATRANLEDQELGKFWQSRYRSVRLLDDKAILACAAYVDLNPIRAGLAPTLEESQFTSVQRRIQSLEQESQFSPLPVQIDQVCSSDEASTVEPTISANTGCDPARFLAPLTIDERHDPIGPDLANSGTRCSNKGFLSMPLDAYLELLDWTARQLAPGKHGFTPQDTPPFFDRLTIEPAAWCKLVSRFGKLFFQVAGHPQTVDSTRTRSGNHRFHLPRATRELLPLI